MALRYDKADMETISADDQPPGCYRDDTAGILHIFFYRQLDFSSEPGVANEILENEN